MSAMKPLMYIIILTGLLLTGLHAHANTLNEAVKEARKQGQVLSAKTRHGMHEIRVVTPQGSVKTIRQPATEHNRVQRYPDSNSRANYYQQQAEPSRQTYQTPDNRHDYERSPNSEFRRFNRPSERVESRMTPNNTQSPRAHRPTQQRRQPPARQRSNDRDPD